MKSFCGPISIRWWRADLPNFAILSTLAEGLASLVLGKRLRIHGQSCDTRLVPLESFEAPRLPAFISDQSLPRRPLVADHLNAFHFGIFGRLTVRRVSVYGIHRPPCKTTSQDDRGHVSVRLWLKNIATLWLNNRDGPRTVC